MKTRLIFAVLAIAGAIGAARAAPCSALPEFLEILSTARPYLEARPLKADATARVVAWFNALPPESKATFNLAVIVLHDNGAIGLLFGNDGKVCLPMVLPASAHNDLMHAIAGGDPA